MTTIAQTPEKINRFRAEFDDISRHYSRMRQTWPRYEVPVKYATFEAYVDHETEAERFNDMADAMFANATGIPMF